MLLKLGSRASTLAKIQSYSVGEKLKATFPELEIEYIFQESKGDKDLVSPLWKLSGQSIFTKDLQDALLAGKIDAIVHSWKDLELNDRDLTKVFSVLSRADERDVLLFKKDHRNQPPSKLKVLTSSPRREYNLTSFIRNFFPSSLANQALEFESVRGNIQTRFKKFMESDASAILIAKAALDRILSADIFLTQIHEIKETQEFLKSKLLECFFMVIPLSQNPCAPAQGALCVEMRANDLHFQNYIHAIVDKNSEANALKERAILKNYGGGCHQKIGVSVIKRDYGEITYLRGITDEGQILNQISFTRTYPLKFKKSEVWPSESNKLKKNRLLLNVEIPALFDLYVTKSFSLPSSAEHTLNDRIVWCSGVKTWSELAARDIWVHGTSDGLGEAEEMNLFHLVPRKLNFLKLTHDDSQDQFLATLKTYHLELQEKSEGIENHEQIQAAYWSSGSEFFYLINHYPHWKNLIHFCGPGTTYSKIKQYLGESATVYICPSYKYWEENYLEN